MAAPARNYSHPGSPFSETRTEMRKLLGIAWPLSLSYIGHIAIGTTDVLMIGRLGAEPLAAAAIAISVYHGIYMFCAGVVIAVTPLASQALGARNPRQARRSVRQGVWVALTLSIPGLLMLWQIDKVLELLFQDRRLIGQATDYMHFFMWGLVPTLMFDALRCFMIALGRARPTLIITLVGIILNAVLNYGLLYGNLGMPEMGLPGAGLSSMLVNITMFLLCAGVLYARLPYRRYHILGNIWRADWPTYGLVFRLGIPIGIGLLLEQGMFSAATLIAGSIGPVETAAHAIAMNIITVAFMTASGLAEGATARVGVNYGRRDAYAIRLSAATAIITASVFMAVICLIYLAIPELLVGLFMDAKTDNAGLVLALAAQLLLIAAFFEFFDGFQVVAVGALHGLSDTKTPMIVGAVTYWGIGISAALVFAKLLDWGVTGIWLGMSLGVMTTAACYALRLRRLTRTVSWRD